MPNVVEFRETRAGDIPPDGIFLWMNGFFVILKQDNRTADGWVAVKKIASGWTMNPYDRFQYSEYKPERFQGDCLVQELLFKARPTD